MKTIATNVTLTIHDGITISGDIERGTYTDGQTHLRLTSPEGDIDDLSVNLSGYGLTAAPGTIYVPDYSEHTGTADALATAGIVTRIRPITFGPHRTTAWECSLTD